MDFTLTQQQQQMIEALDELGQKEFAPKASRWDQNHEYPAENLELLRKMGVLGMTIPEKFGAGASAHRCDSRHCDGSQVLRCDRAADRGNQHGGARLHHGVRHR